ncbi:membrane protein insertase YidC [Rickettsiales bacterium]|nr:membrane protein insertase YidC [Rickettsiales bacterium]
MEDKKNLIIALILSVGVITSWNYFVEKPRYDEFVKQQEVYDQQIQDVQEIEKETQNVREKRISAATSSPRITFEDNEINGSLNRNLGYIDDLTLKNYVIAKDSDEKVQILNKKYEENSYFIDFGYITKTNDNINQSVEWSSNTDNFQENITLSKQTESFSLNREISIIDKYLFKITDSITNTSNYNQEIKHYGLINRGFPADSQSFLILHEGPISVINDELQEETFKKVKKGDFTYKSINGWTGFSDKYWLTAIIPQKQKSYNYNIHHYLKNDQTDRFQNELSSNWYELRKDESYNFEYLVFVGPKELELLDKYSVDHDIKLFDRALDFGVLYFMTKPISKALHYINQFVNNFGVTIIIFTILLRLLLYPLADKSFREIYKMKQLQPEIKSLKEKHKDNRMALNKEIMSLYKKYSVKPMAGCLPLLVQIPVFFALYKVLFVTIEMRQAEFFGWISDLSVPDPTSIINLFGLLPFEPFFDIGIWPCLMGLTMMLQQKFNPTPQDPMQETMMKILPYMFTFIFATFPAGLVIYWTFNNALSILQQYLINRKHSKKKA